MKHTIDIKFPKLFGRKKKNSGDDFTEESDITTEIVIDVDGLKKLALPISVGVASISVGYLVGFKSGVTKVLDTNVIALKTNLIMKDKN